MIAISSGHGKYVAGAADLIDEVTEARRVVDRVYELLTLLHVPCLRFHEDMARNAKDNLNNIIGWHNRIKRDMDVSIHFNSVDGGTRTAGIGVETLYRKDNLVARAVAAGVSQAISEASGLILRRHDGTLASNLGFLTRTGNTAILIEVCFVNSRVDVELYHTHFDRICVAIAEQLSGMKIDYRLKEKCEVRYNTLEEIQEKLPWAYPTIKMMVDNGVLSGTDANNINLDLSLDMIRMLVILNRLNNKF